MQVPELVYKPFNSWREELMLLQRGIEPGVRRVKREHTAIYTMQYTQLRI